MWPPSIAILVSILAVSQLQDSVLSWSSPLTQPIRSPNKLLLRVSESCENEEIPVSDTNRRQWIQNLMGSAAVLSVGFGCSSPSIANAAADLVTTKSVCDTTVSVWQKDGRLIYLLGTAHVSAESAILAGQLVKDTIPSGVFVELDMKRAGGGLAKYLNDFQVSDTTGAKSRLIVPDVQAMTASAADSQVVGSMDGGGTVKKSFAGPSKSDNNPLSILGGKALKKEIGGMYQEIDDAGIKPGEEFVNAIKEGAQLGSAIVLGDQDVDVSLRRMAKAIFQTDLKLMMGSDSELEATLAEISGSGDVFKETGSLKDEKYKAEFTDFVEKVKTKESVRKMMTQLKRLSPAMYDALVGERDAYMAAGLNGLNELES
ncbi:MAG: hypothetical protein SGILL_003246, partial [Bacillariaceae sp.]